MSEPCAAFPGGAQIFDFALRETLPPGPVIPAAPWPGPCPANGESAAASVEAQTRTVVVKRGREDAGDHGRLQAPECHRGERFAGTARVRDTRPADAEARSTICMRRRRTFCGNADDLDLPRPPHRPTGKASSTSSATLQPHAGCPSTPQAVHGG